MGLTNFKKIVAIVGMLLLVIIGIYAISAREDQQPDREQDETKDIAFENKPSESEKPQIISTNPDPLDGAIIKSNEQIEFVFNRSLENEGEFKFRIEPEIKYKITLSNERKTVKIIPEEPFDLGHGYTIYITGDTKFTGYGPWGEEKTFHFQTIKYRGI